MAMMVEEEPSVIGCYCGIECQRKSDVNIRILVAPRLPGVTAAAATPLGRAAPPVDSWWMLPAARAMHNLSEFCSRCGSTRADVEGCPVEGEIVGPPTTASLESCSSGAPARFTALEVAALVLLPCLSLLRPRRRAPAANAPRRSAAQPAFCASAPENLILDLF